MTKRNEKNTFIANDVARKASFKKRKTSLLKKTKEISTLCGIEACAIIYGLNEEPHEPNEPEVWPSPLGVQQVVNKFRGLSEVDQNRKMVDQERFLIQRIQKVKDQVKRRRMANKVNEMNLQMFQHLGGGGEDLEKMDMIGLRELSWVIDQKLNDISKAKGKVQAQHQAQAQAQAQAQMVTLKTGEDHGAARITHGNKAQAGDSGQDLGVNFNMDVMEDEWFMNLLNDGMDETLLSLIGDVSLQTGLVPNLFPWKNHNL